MPEPTAFAPSVGHDRPKVSEQAADSREDRAKSHS